jgi:hypothetical protein
MSFISLKFLAKQREENPGEKGGPGRNVIFYNILIYNNLIENL